MRRLTIGLLLGLIITCGVAFADDPESKPIPWFLMLQAGANSEGFPETRIIGQASRFHFELLAYEMDFVQTDTRVAALWLWPRDITFRTDTRQLEKAATIWSAEFSLMLGKAKFHGPVINYRNNGALGEATVFAGYKVLIGNMVTP